MAKVIGPWTPNYPVDFKSNGDTTRAAFGKHIQEIERIYGLLSGLGAAKIEAEDLTSAMTANKNEWATAIATEKSARESAIAAEVTARSNGDVALGRRIDGLTFGDIGGTLGLDRTMGDLPSSRVSGNFGTDRIDGLENFVKAHNVSEGNVNPNGYVKFGNGLIIQWGEWEFSDFPANEYIMTRNFYKNFPNACFTVLLTPHVRLQSEVDNVHYYGVDAGIFTVTWTTSQCRVLANGFSGSVGDIKDFYAGYLAIGN